MTAHQSFCRLKAASYLFVFTFFLSTTALIVNGQVTPKRDLAITAATLDSSATQIRITGENFGKQGDIFARKLLTKSIKNFSKSKYIYPISLENVKIKSTENESWVDMTICVKERPKINVRAS